MDNDGIRKRREGGRDGSVTSVTGVTGWVCENENPPSNSGGKPHYIYNTSCISVSRMLRQHKGSEMNNVFKGFRCGGARGL